MLQAESAKDIANNPFVTVRKAAKKGGSLPAKSRAFEPQSSIAEIRAPTELKPSLDSKPSEEKVPSSEAASSRTEADRAPLETLFPTAAAAADSAAPEASPPLKTSLEMWAKSQPDDSFWTSNGKIDDQQVFLGPASQLPADTPLSEASSEAANLLSGLPVADIQQSPAAAEANREPQKSQIAHVVSSTADNKDVKLFEQAVLSATQLEENCSSTQAMSQTDLAIHETARTSGEDAASQSRADQDSEASGAKDVSESLELPKSPASRPSKVSSTS